MSKPNPIPWYPRCEFDAADAEEFASLLANNSAHLDHEAAGLIDHVANHHRDDWQNPATAVRLRRILRLVASHLRGEW